LKKVFAKKLTRLVSGILALTMTICGSPEKSAVAADSEQYTAKAIELTLEEVKNSDALVATVKSSKQKGAAYENLPKATIAEIFSKMPPLPKTAQQSQNMVLPEDSLIKPKVKSVEMQEPFPPLVSAIRQSSNEDSSSSLKVLTPFVSLISHSGPVNQLEQLNISFSKPMIGLGRIPNPVDVSKLVQISPQPPGAWQWAGTQTLLFKPTGHRFPQATQYTVSIPASAESMDGSKTEQEITWKINTPAVKVAGFDPHFDHSTAPVMVASFNQKIDPSEVLKFITVIVGAKRFSTRLLAKEEANWIQPKPIDNWMAFETIEKLPKNLEIKVVFEKGIPSAEGPLTSSVTESRSFKTPAPFCLLKDVHKEETSSESSYRFVFSNSLSHNFKGPIYALSPEARFTDKLVVNNRVTVVGRFEPHTDYKITFSKNLEDIYGQTLGQEYSEPVPWQGRLCVMSNLKPSLVPSLSFISCGSSTRGPHT